MNVRIGWEVVERSEDHIDYALIIGALVPTLVCCCVSLCAYSYYLQRQRSRTAPDIRYFEMNRHEDISETVIENRFPSQYYLEPKEITCAICFDW